jgi:hypothetical protein
MKEEYLNNLVSSFYLWIDHTILSKGEAFKNYSGSLYSGSDPKYGDSSSVYASPFKQFVYDSSISGANIPSGLYFNSGFIPKGVSGLSIDYMNGRALFNGNTVNIENPSILASVKEFNIYYTDEKEEILLFEKSQPLTNYARNYSNPINYNDLPFPCIFIKNNFSQNAPFAFGGQDKTSTSIRAIVLASNSFQLDAVISLLNDSNKENFPILNSEKLPFNYLNDFKESGFNYKLACNNSDKNRLAYIENISVSKLDEVANSKINKKCSAGIIDFEISNLRFPRAR